MKRTLVFGAVSAVLALASASAEIDCLKLSLSVKHAVAADQSKVLEVVSNEVSAAPGCACEVVKAAIEGVSAKPEVVAAIVEAASAAAPEQMRMISQCAVAVAPDALAQVQMVVAKLDPNSGESGSSAKGAKGAAAAVSEVASMPNPLDFPGQGPVGPVPGSGPGGESLFPVTPPVIVNPPDVVNPPVVTESNPT